MQSLLILFMFILGSHALSQEFVDKTIEQLQEVGGKCAEKEGATADDIGELMEQKFPPSTHTGKCVIACVYEHYKGLNPDLTWNKPAIIDAFEPLKNEDAEMYGKVLKITDVCLSKVPSLGDRCETASAMVDCVKTEAHAMGLDQDSLMG